MNHSLFALLLFLIPVQLLSQKGSANTGVSYGFGNSNIIKHTVLADRYESILTNSISFKFDYFLTDQLSIETGVGIEQRGGEFISYGREIPDREPFILGDTIPANNQNKFAYLAIPLGAVYNQNLNQKLSFNFLLGAYFNVLVEQSWNFERLDVFTTIEGGTLQFNYLDYDFGIYGGIGLEYELTTLVSTRIDFKLQRGVLDVFEDTGIEGYHLRNSMNLGLKIGLGRNSKPG